MDNLYRAQVSFSFDSLLPRDRMMINPHFHDSLGGTDTQELADDLSSSLANWCVQTCETRVAIYEAGTDGSGPPLAYQVRNVGNAPAAVHPREVALCLSYYSARNEPSRRGRFYIPEAVIHQAQLGVRPHQSHMDRAGFLPGILADLGGANIDWVLYSPKNNTFHEVTNWWIDNEWDTVRSRGLRATSRQAGTVDEGFVEP